MRSLTTTPLGRGGVARLPPIPIRPRAVLLPGGECVQRSFSHEPPVRTRRDRSDPHRTPPADRSASSRALPIACALTGIAAMAVSQIRTKARVIFACQIGLRSTGINERIRLHLGAYL